MRQRNYKIILTVTIGFLLSFSAASAKNFNIFNAASPSQSYFTVNGTSGNVGIGITNPTTLLQILNNGWISAQNAAGTGVVNMFKVNASNQIEVGAPLNIGSFEFSPDSGLVSFVDMPVTSGAASGTPEGYAFKVDGDNIMTAYSESNGAGGIQNKRLGIGLTNPTTALDVAGSLRNTLATTHSLLGGGGNVLVMADNTGTLYATSTAGFLGGGSDLWGGTTTGKIWNANYGYNIGLGTTNPFRKLDINQAVDGTQLQVRNNGADTLSQSAGIQFSIGDSGVTTDEYAKGALFFKGDGSDWGRGDFVFALDNAADAGNASTSDAKMVIRKDGNVGIGVTNPGAKLSVSGNSTIGANWGRSTLGLSVIASYNNSAQSSPGDADRTLHLENPDNTTGSFAGLTMRAGNDGNASWYHIMHKKTGASTGTALHFVQATQVMALTSGGNVGIGTTAPTNKLEVLGGNVGIGTDFSNGLLNFQGNSTTTIISATRSDNSQPGALIFDGWGNFSFNKKVGIGTTDSLSGSTADLYVNGNVGIGITNPNTKLYVSGTSLNTLATTHSLLGGAGNVLVMADNTGALYATSTAGFSGGTNFWGGTKNSNIWNGDAGVGNVGIGTTAPSARLHVYDTTSSSSLAFFRNNTDIGSIEIKTIAADTPIIKSGSSDSLNFSSNNSDTPSITINSGGNVGIGTTNPGAKLNVAGSILGNTDDTFFGMDTNNPPRLGYTKKSGSAPKLTHSSSTSFVIARSSGGDIGAANTFTDEFVINSVGNVGIGTTNPAAKLHTARSLVSGTHYDTGSVLTIEDAESSLQIVSSDAGNDASALVLTNVVNSGDNRHWIFGARGVSSSYRLDIGYKTSAASSYINTGLWTGMSILTNGNLGIGTTSPAVKLDVIGALRNTLATTHSLLGGAGNVVVMADNTGALYATSTASLLSGGTSLWGGTLNGTIYNGDAGAGNVGIGTTTPSTKLQIVTSGTNGVVIGDTAYPSWMGAEGLYVDGAFRANSYLVNSGGTINWGASTAQIIGYSLSTSDTNSYIGFLTGETGNHNERMRIINSGNIGMGTTSPTALLHLSSTSTATLKINSTSALGDDSDIRFVKSNNGAETWTLGRDNTSNDFKLSYVNNTTGGLGTGDLVTFKSSGNVGIGTTSPVHKLDISGGNYTNQLRVISSDPAGTGITLESTDTGGREFSIISTGTGDYPGAGTLTFWDNTNGAVAASARMVINSAGNVGIGQTSPGTKLDVSGTLRNTLATTHSLLGGAGNVVVMADNTGALYATSTASLLSGGTSLWGGTLNGNIWNGDSGAGNVGIGVTNPISKLELYEATGAGIRITGAVNSTSTLIDLLEGTGAFGTAGTYGFRVLYNGSSNYFNLNSGNGTTVNTRMAIERDSGNVGIGFATPGAKLDINQVTYGLPQTIATSTQTYGALRIEAATSGNVVLDMGTGGSSSGTWLQATNKSDLSLSYSLLLNPNGGNVGIGITNPSVKLDVTGTFRNTLATTHSLLGGGGEVLVMADNNGNLYSTSTAGFIGGSGSYLPLTGGSLSGNLNMGGNNITNINKLTVNTIDPLYNIQGINYSTFASSIAGGVKEEYLGRVKINNLTADGEREYVIDFNTLAAGSDLWVWRKTVDFSSENVEVVATPYGNFAQVYYKIEGNKIIFRADRPTTISYRLSGRRIDWRNWPTKSLDQTEKAGFVIE
ncbi:MAG: hypothetical protein HY931_02275 [Candidatus Falkowbacteria bacterium]|nr:MAG: hypothetical protein HY931_02275 [Candidatus Falkowbacteria bacterium]